MQIELATLPIVADDALESERDIRLLIANVVFDVLIVRCFIRNLLTSSSVKFAHSLKV